MYSCQQLLKRPTFAQELKDFAEEYKVDVVILLGSGDLLAWPVDHPKVASIQQAFAKKQEQLGIIFESALDIGAHYYQRQLPSVSRKQILPTVSEAIQ
jgi:hypothetical protein